MYNRLNESAELHIFKFSLASARAVKSPLGERQWSNDYTVRLVLQLFWDYQKKKLLKFLDAFIGGGLLSLYFYSSLYIVSLIVFESQLNTVVFQYLWTFSFVKC